MAIAHTTTARGLTASAPRRFTRAALSTGSGSARSVVRGNMVVVRAAADESAVATSGSGASTSASASTSGGPPVLVWPVDNETAKDVFAFSGSLPERLNGRLAMLGFVGIVAAERSAGTPALEQFGGDVLGVALLSVALLFASIFPKFASGSSLKDLHAAATGANLKAEGVLGQALGLFDTNVELWSGRLAMVGIAGTLVLEAVTGNTLL